MPLPYITWVEYPRSFKVSLAGFEDTVYSVGNTVLYSDRKDNGVLITEILGKETDAGPMGFTYLPWRDEAKRWGSPLLSFKGDPRFIVCYPGGNQRFGLHIDWTTFRYVEHPDKAHPAFVEVVEKLTKK